MAAFTTQAERRGDRYVVHGMKSLITSSRSTDVAMVVAVTDSAAGKRGISAFLVRTNSPGWNVVRAERKLGHRSNDTCQIALDRLEVPASDILALLGKG